MLMLWTRLTSWTWRPPSILTEILSGLLTVALATFLLWLAAFGVHPLHILVLATALSLVYEVTMDANGWSVKDVAEREAGIGLGVLLLWVLA